jgi:hypothetical protein
MRDAYKLLYFQVELPEIILVRVLERTKYHILSAHLCAFQLNCLKSFLCIKLVNWFFLMPSFLY